MKELQGESAEVTSSLPLSDKEKNSIKKSVGVDDISFKVDPNILGGLIIRVGGRVVDDSVASQMTVLKDSLLT